MLRLFYKLLATVIGLCFAQISPAQHHYNAWFRGTLSIPIGKKFKIDNEFQHRRQNGFENINLFDKNLMFTYRNWVHYQHKEDVRFSISPFAYFTHYKIIQGPSDKATRPNNEIRFSAAVELQHEIFKKFYIIDRNALEYRIFGHSQPDITRLRSRFGIRYDFTEKVKLSIFDELLLNLTGTTHDHFFDHDRLGLNVEYQIGHNLKFDMGYIYITRLPITSNSKLHESNFYLHLTYIFPKRMGISHFPQIRGHISGHKTK